jgi:predicted RNase H-like HicB family nuclease
MNLKVILEPSGEVGFTGIVPSVPGCISEGDTREEASAKSHEAIELSLDPTLRAPASKVVPRFPAVGPGSWRARPQSDL